MALGYTAYVNPEASVAVLNSIAARAENMRPVFTIIRDLMLSDQRKNFDSQGSTFGEKWPSLSPATHNGDGGILTKTGALETAAKGGAGKVSRITKTGVRVGINQRIYYARFHQAGASGGSRKGDMPERRLVGITSGTRAKSLDLIQKYLAS